MGKRLIETIEIPPATAKSFKAMSGQVLRIIDINGKQVGDFISFNLHDLSEKFSSGRTRTNNSRLRVTKGDRLFSNNCNVMYEIIDDTCGVHDLLYPPCCTWVFEHRYKVEPKTGCLEHLAASLEEYGIQEKDIPDPLNVFMRTDIIDSDQLKIIEPTSKAGDYIDLRAEMDCIAALSSCAVDCGPVNAFELKPLLVELYEL